MMCQLRADPVSSEIMKLPLNPVGLCGVEGRDTRGSRLHIFQGLMRSS